MKSIILKKAYFFLALILSFTVSLAGCGSNDVAEEPLVEESGETEEVVEIEELECPTPAGMAFSPFTGRLIPEEMARLRPVAIQINNIRAAYPQSGISQADIIYETLAEGNITRLLAIFHVFDAEKIGPIRSARRYFLDMAANHDALYIHYGGSPQAYSYIAQRKSHNLDGITRADGVLTWRDPARRSIPRMLEHSVYTSRKLIDEAWYAAGYRKKLADGFESGLHFRKEPRAPFGQRADFITIPFSNSYVSVFDYDYKSGEYIKYNADQLHMDELVNQPLTFTNLIIQRTEMFVIPGDDAGRREVKIIGKGTGYFISKGRKVAITWSKDAYDKPTRYVETKTGKPVEMNPGKTYIAIVSQRQKITFVKSPKNQ